VVQKKPICKRISTPGKAKTFVQHATVPWYNQVIQAAKPDRRRMQRLYNMTGLVLHQHMFREARNRVGDLIDHAQSDHYNDKIVQCGSDQRTIFKVVDNVLDRRSVVFPTCASNQEMAQNFGEFFRDKIAKIRNGLQ